MTVGQGFGCGGSRSWDRLKSEVQGDVLEKRCTCCWLPRDACSRGAVPHSAFGTAVSVQCNVKFICTSPMDYSIQLFYTAV